METLKLLTPSLVCDNDITIVMAYRLISIFNKLYLRLSVSVSISLLQRAAVPSVINQQTYIQKIFNTYGGQGWVYQEEIF